MVFLLRFLTITATVFFSWLLMRIVVKLIKYRNNDNTIVSLSIFYVMFILLLLGGFVNVAPFNIAMTILVSWGIGAAIKATIDSNKKTSANRWMLYLKIATIVFIGFCLLYARLYLDMTDHFDDWYYFYD